VWELDSLRNRFSIDGYGMAIEGEDRCVAFRRRTCDGSELPTGSAVWHRDGPGLVLGFRAPPGAVWFRDGRGEDVLAELFERQEGRPP